MKEFHHQLGYDFLNQTKFYLKQSARKAVGVHEFTKAMNILLYIDRRNPNFGPERP